MNENGYDDRMLEYVTEDISPERKRELERILTERGFDPEELEELRNIYRRLGELPLPEPGESMTGRFYQMLEAEKSRLGEQRSGSTGPAAGLSGWSMRTLWPRLAYAALFILIGWTASYWISPGSRYEQKLRYMTGEMTEMKKMMMFSMLNRSSPSERLQAVQYLRDLIPGDDQVLTAMLGVFERDPNVNVRLATLDALAGNAKDDRVRRHLIHGILQQDAPIVQLALVDVMVSMGESGAIEPLRHMLEKEDLNMNVRNRITEGLRLLS
jgi:hypothetical protein